MHCMAAYCNSLCHISTEKLHWHLPTYLLDHFGILDPDLFQHTYLYIQKDFNSRVSSRARFASFEVVEPKRQFPLPKRFQARLRLHRGTGTGTKASSLQRRKTWTIIPRRRRLWIWFPLGVKSWIIPPYQAANNQATEWDDHLVVVVTTVVGVMSPMRAMNGFTQTCKSNCRSEYQHVLQNLHVLPQLGKAQHS